MRKIANDNIKQIIKVMMAEKNVESFKEIAEALNTKETTFRGSITRRSLRLVDFIAVADYLGYDVVIKEKSSN